MSKRNKADKVTRRETLVKNGNENLITVHKLFDSLRDEYTRMAEKCKNNKQTKAAGLFREMAELVADYGLMDPDKAARFAELYHESKCVLALKLAEKDATKEEIKEVCDMQVQAMRAKYPLVGYDYAVEVFKRM